MVNINQFHSIVQIKYISRAIVIYLLLWTPLHAQSTHMQTYCNPVNIDYTYTVYNAKDGISYRAGADPAVVAFRGEYYMFVTRSMGYWHSKDLNSWSFVEPEKWYFQGSNAPTAHNYKDSVLIVAGDPSGQMSPLYTDNPKKGDWKPVPMILGGLQDPHLFIDDNDSAYVFWGSSNRWPIRVRELDMGNNFKPDEEVHELFNLDPEQHGWERFGEDHRDEETKPFIEGPWMTKHKGVYYLQYAAPGTQFNVYGDGVYTSDHPLGPYTYAPHNPVFYKPGGFLNGAGHGSTVKGPDGKYWHFATMDMSVNMTWERRICMFPAGFDEDGIMYGNMAYGDYPHYAPAEAGKMGEFTGWMLLSYKKPVATSSAVGDHLGSQVVDESVKSFWLAESNREEEWISVDLEDPGKVFAIQVNYHDHESGIYGKAPRLFHRYVIEGSLDGEHWVKLVDRSNNFKDVPNDYVELTSPQEVRYVKFTNLHTPTPHLAISGLRIFGKGNGNTPGQVQEFIVNRQEDQRNALLSWEESRGAQGYLIRWGIDPEKLYSSWMVYDETELDLRSLNVGQEYYFTIEAFNESGISSASKIHPIP